MTITTEKGGTPHDNRKQQQQNGERMNSNELTKKIKEVSKKYGYEDAVAQFIPIRDFKVRWTRTFKWISVEVCDYLADAPDEVIESLLTTIFERISGKDDAAYGPELTEYLTSEKFVREHQPMYLNRCRGYSKTPCGTAKNLDDSYNRLIDKGLVEDDRQAYIGWGAFPSPHVVARTSVIMKAVAVSDLLDKEDVDDDVVDYVLYAQIVRLKMGFEPTTRRRCTEYNELLDRFPGRYALERKLELMDMHI